MNTPVPLPMLSGDITIENVEKVEMFTQLSLLREFIDEPEIMLNPMMDHS